MVEIHGEKIPQNVLIQLWKGEVRRIREICKRLDSSKNWLPIPKRMPPTSAFFVKEYEFERLIHEIAGNLSWNKETGEVFGLHPEYHAFKIFGLSLAFSVVDKGKIVEHFDVHTQGIVGRRQKRSLTIVLTYPEPTKRNQAVQSYSENIIRESLLDCMSQYMCSNLSPDFMDVNPFRDCYIKSYQIAFEEFKRLKE